MMRTIATKEQAKILATHLITKGLEPASSSAWLKSKSYSVKGISFSGKQVESIMEGMYLLEDLVMKGKATLTKSKGLVFK